MKRIFLLLILIIPTMECLSFQQANIAAFVYHRFGDDRYPSTNIDVDKFEAHLKHLKDNEYTVLTITDALKRLKKSDATDKVAVITIDDAYKSFYNNGWPLLKKYGFAATLYLNTETVGATDFMNWQQINEVAKAGIEIGNHSHSHAFFLDNFDENKFKSDLDESRKLFKSGMKKVPSTYAYPYGEWNSQMAEILDSKKYSSAVAQNSGIIHKESNRFSLPRFPMSNEYAAIEKFTEKLELNALEVTSIKTYSEGSRGSVESPTIILDFNENRYDLRYLQVFIQGAQAKKSVTISKEGLVQLTISPKSPLTKRRTLFTVTIPNRQGNWSWFSYTYVMPKNGQ